MNNNENNEGLNSISLGSVDNNGGQPNVPLNPEIPVNPPMDSMNMDSLDSEPISVPNNMNPVETPQVVPTPMVDNNITNPNPIPDAVQPIPDVNAIPPVEPVSYDVPQPMNDINTTPFMNEIGTVPPIPDAPINNGSIPDEPVQPKKKSGMPKILFVLIIVLALAAVGVGVYILLGMSRKSVSIVTKPVEIEVNAEVSKDIKDYATFSGIDSNKCSLDTSAITDTSEIGKEYSFIITCNDVRYTGKATIVDSVAPEATTKDLSVGLNENVAASDFIDGDCEDATECTYLFEDEEKVKEYLTKEGKYTDIVIVIRDEAGNETKKTVTLEVSVASASLYLNCQKSVNGYTEETKLGLNNQNLFNKTGIRKYTFKLNSDTYNSLKNSSVGQSMITYQNITGEPTFNDTDMTLTISKNMTYEDLSSEANGTIPESYADLRNFYMNMGYSCSIGY